MYLLLMYSDPGFVERDELLKLTAPLNLGAARIHPDPPPAAAGGTAVRRCVFAACPSDSPTEGLRECPCGSGPHHHFCSIAAGCEDGLSLCARCLNVPAFEEAAPNAAVAVAAPAAGVAAAPAMSDEEDERPRGRICMYLSV